MKFKVVAAQAHQGAGRSRPDLWVRYINAKDIVSAWYKAKGLGGHADILSVVPMESEANDSSDK